MNYAVNTIGQSNTAARLYEYLLIAMPDDVLASRLRTYQQGLMQDVYPGAEALPIRHLTLAGLMAKDYLEETLARWIMKVCRMRTSFSLPFDGDLKLHEGVLSLQIAPSPELRSFHLQLGVVDDFLNASGCTPLQLISRPELPLLIPAGPGRQRLPSFNYDCEIREIAMLKRNEFENRFEKVNVFGLAR